MKHISPYKSFIIESQGVTPSTDYKETLRDMSLDISDDYFDIDITTKRWEWETSEDQPVYKKNQPYQKEISVFISKSKAKRDPLKEFYLCDISSCVQRMVDYMRGEGYSQEIYVMIKDQRSYLAWNDIPNDKPLDKNCLGGKKIKYLDIVFTKNDI